MGNKHNPAYLFLETFSYHVWFESEESDDTIKSGKELTDLPSMPALVGDEVKEGKWLKILTPNKLLTRLPILLAQIIHTN